MSDRVCKLFWCFIFLFVFVLVCVVCEAENYETASQQLFLNLGFKKKLKDSRSKLENAILKSKVEILGEIFKKHVDRLKFTQNDQVELIFIVDASSSVGEENFKSELKFVKKLVADFIVGPNHTRVAVITFGTNVITNINHLSPNSPEEREKCSLLHFELPAVKYTGGNTYTLGALLEAQKILNHSRPRAHQALFLITDGYSNNGYPVPTARKLKESGVTIFTFGIKSGNIEELHTMATKPEEEHSFIVESFAEFEAVARRALHKDLKIGSYMKIKNIGLCRHLCSNKTSEESNCCVKQAQCSCGTLTGHFVCLCPPGYYGSGVIGNGCHVCPPGTYNDGRTPGDISVCKSCPDMNQKTSQYPATSIKHCVCKENFVPVGNKCEVVTCPHLEPPNHGYFVKESCSNVLNAACGVRCNVGYELHGSSVRLCQLNGTWSGTSPVCKIKSCEKPNPIPNSELKCSHESEKFAIFIKYDENGRRVKETKSISGAGEERLVLSGDKSTDFIIDTECSFSCSYGFSLVGSQQRTCLPLARWDGLQTFCKPVVCPSLQAIPNGQITPDNCTKPGLKHSFGTICNVTCEDGYHLKGRSSKQCNGKYGTWSGKNSPNKCVDIIPPEITCPQNMTVITDDGEKFGSVNITLQEPEDNGPGPVVVWSKPIIDRGKSLVVGIGETRVEVTARDPAGNTNTCHFYISVLDVEPPMTYNCESPQIFQATSDQVYIKWEEPTFTDNSGPVEKIIKTHQFGNIGLGMTQVLYTAYDQHGNTAYCEIDIVVLDHPCISSLAPTNAVVNCSSVVDSISSCLVSCSDGFQLAAIGSNQLEYICRVNGTNAQFSNKSGVEFELLPDCSESISPIVEEEGITIETDLDICNYTDKIDAIINDLQVEVNNLLKTDDEDAQNVSLEAKCNEERIGAEEEITNSLSEHNRSRRSPGQYQFRFVLSDYNPKQTGIKKKKQKALDYVYSNSFTSNGATFKVKVNSEPTLSCNNGTILRGHYCVNCPVGTYYNFINITCESCAIGEFQNHEGQLNCQPCPEGYSTRKPHSRHPSDCKSLCQPGTFGKAKKYNNIGLSPCIPCPVGFYQPAQGKLSCQKCQPGTTTIKTGSRHVKDCKEDLDIEKINNPCLDFVCGHGQCVVDNGFPFCVCQSGYIGSRCSNKTNPCHEQPCYNGAKCRSLDNDYVCLCGEGFHGKQCELEVDYCLGTPCLNGGTCVSVSKDYKCECQRGFRGDRCQENIDECEILSPCLNNSTCSDGENEFFCTCDDQFTGRFCDRYQGTSVCEDGQLDCPARESVPLLTCHGVECGERRSCKLTRGDPVCVCSSRYEQDCVKERRSDVVLSFVKCSTTDYIQLEGPNDDIHNITVCMWIQTTDNFNYGTLFSYAVEGQDNVFTLTDYNGFVLYVNGKYVITDIIANDGSWHHVCVIWSCSNGSYGIYLDGTVIVSGHGLSTNKPLSPSGIMIFGQEQDSVGGNFNEVESFVGSMFDVQVWDSTLDETRIKSLYSDCETRDQGNLYNWYDVLANVRGNVTILNSTFCRGCKPIDYPTFRGIIEYVADVDEQITEVRYKCDPGYVIKLPSSQEQVRTSTWSRKCTKQGEWQDKSPSCNRVSCGFPGYFPHGTTMGRSYQYLDIMKYTCNPGYDLVGAVVRMCQADGTWRGDKPYCKSRFHGCQELVAPRFSSMFVMSENGGQRVEFVCDDGYVLQGHSLLTCTERHEWDHEVPYCEAQLCSLPSLGSNSYLSNTTDGARIVKQKFQIGEHVQVNCEDGYDGTPSRMWCVEAGNWNVTDVIKCRKGVCTRPQHPQHGFVIDDGRGLGSLYYEDDVVRFGCRHGYNMIGDQRAKCLSNGTWHLDKTFACLAVECPTPPVLDNTVHQPTNTSYNYNKVLVYTCLPGYVKQGDIVVRCEADGKWSSPKSHCTKS